MSKNAVNTNIFFSDISLTKGNGIVTDEESYFSAKTNLESAIDLLSVFKGKPSKKFQKRISNWMSTTNSAFSAEVF